MKEEVIAVWFEKNFASLGFDKILERRRTRAGSPDYIVLRNGENIGVEIEVKSSNFIRHQHNPKETDVVICAKKNVELSLPVIEISELYCPVTTIKISKDIKEKLESMGKKGDTYEVILRRVLKMP